MASTGHKLIRELIAKHGIDRYPTPGLSLIKCLEELGELAREILKSQIPGGMRMTPQIRKEYADAGLALYALGDKLGLDLMSEMAAVVDGETRTFTGQAQE
jgi:NTP pyrophosphatase (non-canonical NTP hydrolase)